MTYKNQNCVDSSVNCIGVAAYCSQACIDEGMSECAKYCLECVEICKTMAVLGARNSENVSSVAQVCAEICEACANECKNHDNDHCRDCAEACHKCAEACRNLNASSQQ